MLSALIQKQDYRNVFVSRNWYRDQLVWSRFILLERGRLRKVIKVALRVIPQKKKLSNNFLKISLNV